MKIFKNLSPLILCILLVFIILPFTLASSANEETTNSNSLNESINTDFLGAQYSKNYALTTFLRMGDLIFSLKNRPQSLAVEETPEDEYGFLKLFSNNKIETDEEYEEGEETKSHFFVSETIERNIKGLFAKKETQYPIKNGWYKNLKGNWMYYKNGIKQTGWQRNIPNCLGKTFYFEKDGTMAVGWKNIDGKIYYFNFNGCLMDDNSSGFINVEFIYQIPELPTGCELVALTMILRNNGFDIDKETLANKWVTISDDFYEKDGVEYGPDPQEVFVGDPYDLGWGCFEKCIEKMANNFLKAHHSDKTASTLTNCEPVELYNMIDRGIPVIVWTTIDMIPTYFDREWYTENGELVQMATYEHCVVLVGYDKNYVTINDPLQGTVKYLREEFEDSFAFMGRRAVIIK